MQSALTGIKVVEFSIGIQAPLAGMHLAEHGADVIKIEPPTGDQNRFHAGLGNEIPDSVPSPQFVACNRGKRLITLDAKGERGREVMRKLIAGADVFLSNYREPALQRLGLGYEELRQLNPLLIYATVNGFGSMGPDAHRAMLDPTAQARGGLPHVTGSPDGPPMLAGAAIADTGGAVQLTVGITTALLARERYGVGQHVSTSSYGAQLWLQSWELTHSSMTGHIPRRSGSFHPLSAGGLGIYETADGGAVSLVDTLAPDVWTKFCEFAGKPEVAQDPRWDSVRKRLGLSDPTGETTEQLQPIKIEMFKSRTTAEWEEFFSDPSFVFQRVFDYDDVLNDPQAIANGYIGQIDLPEVGSIKVVGNPIHLTETPAELKPLTAELGRHTEEVLLECGYSWDEISEINEEIREGTKRAYKAAGMDLSADD